MFFLKLRWVLTCALAVFVGGWGANIELKARARANAFCDWVRVGAPAGEIATAAQTLDDEVLRVVRADSVSVGFGGILPRSYHVCSVSTAHEKVSGTARVYVNTLF